MRWTITEDHRQVMAAFFSDFWKLACASFEIPEEPQENERYWKTLVHWADVLTKKYNSDPMICGLVMAFIDGQSDKDTGHRETT